MVRARGTFVQGPTGLTVVDFKTTLNWPLVAVAVAIQVPGLAVLVWALLLVHAPAEVLWGLLLVIAIAILLNGYISIRQAASLDRFVRTELEAATRS